MCIRDSIWKTRTVASIFHGMIAWGFIFYFLVNFGDVVQGYFPIKFMGDGAIGSVYRFLADIFSISVLLGMTYFLLRRFVFNSPVLTFRDNIKLMDKVKAGAVRRDSLIVGLFILAHVGFRFLGETFTVALERLEMGHGDAAQPFANLVSNAVRYGGTVGWIRISARALPGGVEVVIANASPAIGMEQRQRFFDRFYRGDAARNRRSEGSGLGLSLAREIARAHGGDLTLQSSRPDQVRLRLCVVADAIKESYCFPD